MYLFIYLSTLPKLIEHILDFIFVFTMTNCDKLNYISKNINSVVIVIFLVSYFYINPELLRYFYIFE